jgi:transposase
VAKRKTLEMWQKKEVLRQKLVMNRSLREIAQSLGIGKSSVGDVITRAKHAEVTWEAIRDLNDRELEQLLAGTEPAPDPEDGSLPDYSYVHKELKRKGVTRKLLWFEYREENPSGYGYTQFCFHFNEWLKKCDVVMRQEHKAGEKMFVDFSGDTPCYTDPKTGKKVDCELFVAALGASSMTYAEATPSQDLACWIECHTNAVEYFQGVTEITVPDNTKTAVIKPCWYEPELNRTYRDWAQHYGTAVIPARPRRPKDKAKVEAAVNVAQMWILARLRNRTFFSLNELNHMIRRLVDELNDTPMQGIAMSRRELFLSIDKPALKSLPLNRFELTLWKKASVNIDYHVAFDKSFYSVPYTLVRQEVHVRSTRRTVEIFFKGNRIASHARSYQPGKAVTVMAHMPKAHQKYLEWTPTRISGWAAKTGPKTKELVEKLMEAEQHPALAYRRCLGIIRLGKSYGQERLEAACARALALNIGSYSSIKSMLESGLDRKPINEEDRPSQGDHGNVRGQGYYQ